MQLWSFLIPRLFPGLLDKTKTSSRYICCRMPADTSDNFLFLARYNYITYLLTYCCLRWTRVDGPKVSVTVRVNGAPTSDRSAVEGSTVSLHCSTAVANPPVLSESTWWLRNGVVVQDGRIPLVMQQLDRKHAGRYTCSSTNTLAPSGETPRNVTGTETIQLQVLCELFHL